MRFPKLAVSLAALAALALPLLGTTAASAGTVPGSLGQAASQARHHRGLRPEFFAITIVNNGNGVVSASGPIRGTGGTDVEQNNTMGVFSFDLPLRSVNVFHTDVNNVNPVITNPRFCVATAMADGNWAFAGGTGIYRNATGFGTFRFTLTLVLQRKHHRCDLNAQPRFSLVRVFASGLASRN